MNTAMKTMTISRHCCIRSMPMKSRESCVTVSGKCWIRRFSEEWISAMREIRSQKSFTLESAILLSAGALPLIYDWRSPVSSLFYDYDKGQASYEAPMGTLSGEICAKWQYKIRDGEMVYGFESDVKIDDEILKAELGANGEVQLKNIIRTIQKEQNAIIRNTKDKVLVIQGAAGSGKTSVALHRIAYLLYHDRQNLKSSNILILSPNGVFSDYISHILPELGEENIQEMSFDLFAYRKLQGIVADCEDRCDQMERMLSFTEEDPLWKVKESKAFSGSDGRLCAGAGR